MWSALTVALFLCGVATAQAQSDGASSLTIAPCRRGAKPIVCTTGFPGNCGCEPPGPFPIDFPIGPFPFPRPSPQPCICPQVFSPVCGVDGRTYGNSCEARCNGVGQACTGRCPCRGFPPPKPCVCPKNFDPVCGSDGVTYSNTCNARCKGVSVKCAGGCPCRGSPSPPTDCIFANGRFSGNCRPPSSPPPSTPGEINRFLDECVKKGESASVAAARAACSTLKNKCPAVRPQALAASSAARFQGAGGSNPADALLDKVLEGACLSEAENACKNKAFDNLTDATCKRLLSQGPAQSVRGCQSLKDAVNIFNGEVNRLCRNK